MSPICSSSSNRTGAMTSCIVGSVFIGCLTRAGYFFCDTRNSIIDSSHEGFTSFCKPGGPCIVVISISFFIKTKIRCAEPSSALHHCWVATSRAKALSRVSKRVGRNAITGARVTIWVVSTTRTGSWICIRGPGSYGRRELSIASTEDFCATNGTRSGYISYSRSFSNTGRRFVEGQFASDGGQHATIVTGGFREIFQFHTTLLTDVILCQELFVVGIPSQCHNIQLFISPFSHRYRDSTTNLSSQISDLASAVDAKEDSKDR
mmetsp:Transcript_43113/g.49548  ORF Transcript_43113/g.49548 Transcript_43113/m.49548 type:complete len:263 (-) Transcript_43113:377-1165(-)